MGGAYEVSGTLLDGAFVPAGSVKYYSIAGMTIAMDDGSGLKYLLTDHLGSVVAIADDTGTLISQQRYLPFGEVRTDLNGPRITETDFGYTGQRSLDDMGLMDYRARFYDPAIGRFIQPDTIIPSYANPQALNRFGYVLGNPILLNDPTGHWVCEDAYVCRHSDTIESQELAKKRQDNQQPREQNRPIQHGSQEGAGTLGVCTAVVPCIETTGPTDDSGQALKNLGYWTKYGNQLIQLLVELANRGLPLYRQWHGAGTFGPVLEGAAGALLQLGSDMDDPTLTPMQRIARPALIGLEGALTEVISEPWAAAGAAAGAGLGGSAGEIVGSPVGALVGGAVGAAAGYEAGSMGVTWFLDNVVWDPLNEATGLFP